VGPCFLEAYRKADEHLGALLDRLPPDGTLILTSDHGVNGIRRHFLPNVLLRQAGLLATKEGNDYQIDLARTRALYHPANNNYVFLNTKAHRLGWLPESEREATLEAVREVLTRYLDPETGQTVLAAAIRVDHLPPDSELRGQGRGDIFLAVKPGYSLGDSLHQQALVPADLAGHHQQHPAYRPVHGIFECVGPRVRAGSSIGVINHRDIHETMRHLLGLPASGGGGESLGRILGEG
jgi:predicted AlkP superfamily phosphohydrolase/phosphomutase